MWSAKLLAIISPCGSDQISVSLGPNAAARTAKDKENTHASIHSRPPPRRITDRAPLPLRGGTSAKGDRRPGRRCLPVPLPARRGARTARRQLTRSVRIGAALHGVGAPAAGSGILPNRRPVVSASGDALSEAGRGTSGCNGSTAVRHCHRLRVYLGQTRGRAPPALNPPVAGGQARCNLQQTPSPQTPL